MGITICLYQSRSDLSSYSPHPNEELESGLPGYITITDTQLLQREFAILADHHCSTYQYIR